MKNLLDLRDRGFQKVKVFERVIFKPRSFRFELVKMVSVIVIVSVLGWGISNADNLNPFSESGIETATKNFSVIGVVEEITTDKMTLREARGSDNSDSTVYFLDINHLEKVESSNYDPMIITDIQIGEKIIAQGLTNGDQFFIKRVVSFGEVVGLINDIVEPVVATSTETIEVEINASSTATTTIEETETIPLEFPTTTATTTDSESTSTQTENASSTNPVIDVVVDVVEDVIETVTEVVENIVDAVTGTSTPEDQIDEPIDALEVELNPEEEIQDEQPEETALPEITI